MPFNFKFSQKMFLSLKSDLSLFPTPSGEKTSVIFFHATQCLFLGFHILKHRLIVIERPGYEDFKKLIICHVNLYQEIQLYKKRQ